MKKLATIGAIIVCVLGLGTAAAQAAPFTFTFDTLPPGGVLTAAPGQVVGWGYTITNEDPTNWLEFTNFNPPSFGQAAPGYPNSLFDFPFVAPGATVSQAFVPSPGGSGLLEFAFLTTVPNGFVNAGNFDLDFQWWDGDPFDAGNPIPDAAGSTSVPFSVTAVPEPTSLVLLGSGVVGLLARRRSRRS